MGYCLIPSQTGKYALKLLFKQSDPLLTCLSIALQGADLWRLVRHTDLRMFLTKRHFALDTVHLLLEA